MSQVYLASTAGTPSVPTSFTTDDGTAVPVANNLNLLGDDSTVYNANGISTDGTGDTVTILLNSRLHGTGTTSGAVTADVITFDLGATPGVFRSQMNICAFESGTPSGAAFGLDVAVRTTGAAATLIDEDLYPQREAALTVATVNAVVSGNNLIIRVTGVAALDINWVASGTYERAV